MIKQLLDELIQKGSPYKSRTELNRIRTYLYQAPESDWRDRKTPIHLSASALVFVGDRLFFIRHPYLKTTLLPAGHVEAGESPADTALREFTEETGFSFDPVSEIELVDINIFPIPENPAKHEAAHHHVDFRFRLKGHLTEVTHAELPWQLLKKEEAPAEFQIYYP